MVTLLSSQTSESRGFYLIYCSFDYFDAIAGHRTVPIEIGSSYASDDWTQTFMTFHEFCKKYIEKQVLLLN